jgi:antitoxin (DNA-binding transcriptional repressor) of toxin-antitoxin stability system
MSRIFSRPPLAEIGRTELNAPSRRNSLKTSKNMYGQTMIEATAAHNARHFTESLAEVERGETIRIRDQGRMVARMVLDCDFMPGRQAAELFRGHRADAEAANAIAGELSKLDLESKNALDLTFS